MDSDLKPVYTVLFSCKYAMICDRKYPFKLNDKRNVLLLYLLDRHIQLKITAVAYGG